MCYFVRVHTDVQDDPMWDGVLYDWELAVNVWGVRCVFGVGSACFVIGSLCAFPELLSDS